MKRAIVYVVNFQNWIIEQHNRASYPPLFVKNIHIFYLKDFFCFNFPNLKAPLTLRFNKLSYLKQWSETKHWMIACIVLITYFVWVKYIQCQTGTYFKKITLKNKSAKSMNLSFQQVCSFYMFWIYEVNKLRFFFFFYFWNSKTAKLLN